MPTESEAASGKQLLNRAVVCASETAHSLVCNARIQELPYLPAVWCRAIECESLPNVALFGTRITDERAGYTEPHGCTSSLVVFRPGNTGIPGIARAREITPELLHLLGQGALNRTPARKDNDLRIVRRSEHKRDFHAVG